MPNTLSKKSNTSKTTTKKEPKAKKIIEAKVAKKVAVKKVAKTTTKKVADVKKVAVKKVLKNEKSESMNVVKDDIKKSKIVKKDLKTDSGKIESISKAKKEKIVKSAIIPESNNWSEILLTKEWYNKVKDELEYLKTEKRREIASRLREAISYWDLSENSEYEEAKNEQAFVEWRIIELEKKMKNAKIISDIHADTINIWSKVEVEEVLTWIKSVYTIVWSTEAEPFQWRISNESPLWYALIWLKKGNIAKVKAPKWLVDYKILKIL